MSTREAAERWRETWQRCWRDHHVDELVERRTITHERHMARRSIRVGTIIRVADSVDNTRVIRRGRCVYRGHAQDVRWWVVLYR